MLNKTVLLLVVGMSLVGCRSRGHSASSITLEDGTEGYVIECRSTAWCLKKAGQLCPRGYVSRSAGSKEELEASYSGGGGYIPPSAHMSQHRTDTMIIKCKWRLP